MSIRHCGDTWAAGGWCVVLGADAKNSGRTGGLLTGVRKTAPLFCYAYGGERAGRRVAYREKSVAEWRQKRRDGAGRRVAWSGAGVRNSGAWTAGWRVNQALWRHLGCWRLVCGAWSRREKCRENRRVADRGAGNRAPFVMGMLRGEERDRAKVKVEQFFEGRHRGQRGEMGRR